MVIGKILFSLHGEKKFLGVLSRKRQIFYSTRVARPRIHTTEITKGDFGTTRMVESCTGSARNDKIISLDRFFAITTFFRFFTWPAFFAKPVFTSIFHNVKLPCCNITTFNMEEFTTLRTQNISQVPRNSFCTSTILKTAPKVI